MVERSLCMREVRGSIPRISTIIILFCSFLKRPYILGTGPAQSLQMAISTYSALFSLDLNNNKTE